MHDGIQGETKVAIAGPRRTGITERIRGRNPVEGGDAS
jgi:hypothetical protein